MTIYYQHIGERLAQRDFPRSLGTPAEGLKRFTLEDVREYLTHLGPDEMLEIECKASQQTPTGFQIWGIPSGAQKVLAGMQTGDYLFLLESVDFQYCGRVVHRVSGLCWDLSDHIWGEQRFPIILFLDGALISYDWEDFLIDFKFDPAYHMRGNTMRLAKKRFANSTYVGEEEFVSRIISTNTKA